MVLEKATFQQRESKTMAEGTGRARNTIEYQLGELAQEVRTLTKWLQGNGKIGVIQELRLDVDALKQLRVERTIRQKTLKLAFQAVGGLLVWAWGIICGASTWLPKLHAFLKAIGW
jgi:hypothetical protein